MKVDASAYIRCAMEELLIYSAALSTSRCEVAQAVGRQLGSLHNDLDVARESLEDGGNPGVRSSEPANPCRTA